MRRLVVASVLFAAAVAHGHGRPPMTNGVYFTDDRAVLVVPSTIGLLVSNDNGCTFRWVCEESIGYADPFDPHYAAARDGTLYATTFNGLRVSRDGGCTFTTAIPDIYIDALDIGPAGEVWVGTSGGPGLTNDILSSTDNGHTFESRGLPSTTLAYTSVRAAPSDPTRVYATGGRMDTVGLWSRSGGMWKEQPMTGVAFGMRKVVTVAAVDRENPDKLYVISQGASDMGGGDRLYRSTDGGMTFQEVLATTAARIKDVVVRDANIVYVTTLVRAGSIFIGGPALVSSDGGGSFAPLEGGPQLSCVGIAPDGSVFGCGANWMPDYMAVTKLEGTTWNKVWRFVELEGPINCPAGTVGGDVCGPLWQMLDIQLETSGPVCGEFVRPKLDGPPDPPKEPVCGCATQSPASYAGAFAVLMLVMRRRRR